MYENLSDCSTLLVRMFLRWMEIPSHGRVRLNASTIIQASAGMAKHCGCRAINFKGAVMSWPNPAGSWCQKLSEVRVRASATVITTARVEVAAGARYTTSPSPFAICYMHLHSRSNVQSRLGSPRLVVNLKAAALLYFSVLVTV